MQEIHFKHNNIGSMEVKEWKNVSTMETNQSKDGVAILVSEKLDFRKKKITKNVFYQPRRHSNPKCYAPSKILQIMGSKNWQNCKKIEKSKILIGDFNSTLSTTEEN